MREPGSRSRTDTGDRIKNQDRVSYGPIIEPLMRSQTFNERFLQLFSIFFTALKHEIGSPIHSFSMVVDPEFCSNVHLKEIFDPILNSFKKISGLYNLCFGVSKSKFDDIFSIYFSHEELSNLSISNEGNKLYARNIDEIRRLLMAETVLFKNTLETLESNDVSSLFDDPLIVNLKTSLHNNIDKLLKLGPMFANYLAAIAADVTNFKVIRLFSTQNSRFQ